MTTYFILVALALALVLVLVARRFNPVDLDEYDRRIRAILHLPMKKGAE